MKKNNLSLGTKLTLSFGASTVMLALMAWIGIHTVGTTSALFTNTVNVTGRKLVLAGQMDGADSDMAAAQRGLVLYTYAKNPEHVAAAKQRFSKSLGKFRQALTEMRPLL